VLPLVIGSPGQTVQSGRAGPGPDVYKRKSVVLGISFYAPSRFISGGCQAGGGGGSQADGGGPRSRGRAAAAAPLCGGGGFQAGGGGPRSRGLKGKCALGPFLSILVIECQHKCLNVNLCPWMNKVQI
jgi:hypothetical protein